MTKTEAQEAIYALPPREQLELIEEAWARLASQLDFQLTPELTEILEARRDAAIADPEGGVPVAHAHRRIRQRLAGKRGA